MIDQRLSGVAWVMAFVSVISNIGPEVLEFNELVVKSLFGLMNCLLPLEVSWHVLFNTDGWFVVNAKVSIIPQIFN